MNPSGQSFTVTTLRGTTVAVSVSHKTILRRLGSGSTLSVGDLSAGQRVLIGSAKATSTVAAERVIVVPQGAVARLLTPFVGGLARLYGTRTPLRVGGLAYLFGLRAQLRMGVVRSVDVAAGNFTVRTAAGATVTVSTKAGTSYRKLGSTASHSLADLKVGEHVVLVGTRTAKGAFGARHVIIVPARLGARLALPFAAAAGTLPAFVGPGRLGARLPVPFPAAASASLAGRLTAGTVETVDQAARSFTVETLRGRTATVSVSASTVYRRLFTAASLSLGSLKVGEHVLAIGRRTTIGKLDALRVFVLPRLPKIG